MSKTFNSQVFSVHSQERDAVVLRDYAPTTPGVVQTVSYKRTAPKRVKDFPGMEKGEVKHTVIAPDGQIIGIVSISTSIRADALEADRDDLRAVAGAAFDDASFAALVNDQQLPFNA